MVEHLTHTYPSGCHVSPRDADEASSRAMVHACNIGDPQTNAWDPHAHPHPHPGQRET